MQTAMQRKFSNIQKPEKVANNDALPLKAARCDAIAKLKSCWGFE